MSFAIDVVVPSIEFTTGLLKSHLADFTDAELFVRTCPAANHAMWQVGHLVGSEAQMAGAINGRGSILPETFTNLFKKTTATVDDPAAFPTRAELMEAFEKVRATTVETVSALKDEDLGKTAPGLPPFASTFGQLAVLLSTHVAMHIGQLQVMRRVLGKPVLF